MLSVQSEQASYSFIHTPQCVKRNITVTPAAQQYLQQLADTLGGKAPCAETLARALERGLFVVLISERKRQPEAFEQLPTAIPGPTPKERAALDDEW
jgi:coenzyme F420-reducing hydrogenase alpha subunit